MAIVTESLRRGHRVIGVVRDPARHPGLAVLGTGVTVVAGDLTDAGSVMAVASEAAGDVALVNAVTPFTSPPESFDDFDTDYSVRLVANLSRAAEARRCRVVEIGLFATLMSGGVRVFEDAAAFPAFLRPFADARMRGLNAWHDQAADVDWAVLTPPADLSAQAPATRRYRLGDDRLALRRRRRCRTPTWPSRWWTRSRRRRFAAGRRLSTGWLGRARPVGRAGQPRRSGVPVVVVPGVVPLRRAGRRGARRRAGRRDARRVARRDARCRGARRGAGRGRPGCRR